MTDKSQPRIWKDHEVASYLGLSLHEFRQVQPKLLHEGFPAKDRLLNGFDSVRIERWFNQRDAGRPEPHQSVADVLAARTRSMRNGHKNR